MSIHLPAILMFTRVQGFDTLPYGKIYKMFQTTNQFLVDFIPETPASRACVMCCLAFCFSLPWIHDSNGFPQRLKQAGLGLCKVASLAICLDRTYLPSCLIQVEQLGCVWKWGIHPNSYCSGEYDISTIGFWWFWEVSQYYSDKPTSSSNHASAVLLGLVSLAEGGNGGCGTAPQVVCFINLWSSDNRRDPSPPPFEDLAAWFDTWESASLELWSAGGPLMLYSPRWRNGAPHFQSPYWSYILSYTHSHCKTVIVVFGHVQKARVWRTETISGFVWE